MRAFDIIYARYAPRLYGYLSNHVHDRGHVDEIFQTAMLKFHETKEKFDAKYPLSPWIFTICRNVMRDFQRRNVRLRETDLPDQIPAPEEPIEVDNPNIPFSSLSGAQRKVIELRYMQEKDFSEIAETLRVTETNARQMISRAVRKLRRVMEGK
jgi:RNA polymerase sigma-70 factor (ECF subfamily)